MANTEAITRLKRARGATKGQLTRAYNWIRAFNVRDQAIEEVENRLFVIEKAWMDFREKQDALISLDPVFENDGELEAVEVDYYAATAAAKAIIATKQQQANQLQNSTALNFQNASNQVNSINEIKLPPINLPSFNGSYDQWPNFRDTFKAIVDENKNLSDIKKLYYLRLALKGGAAKIIASIEMSDENYQVAWRLLEGRFENKRVLVHHHLQALIKFPAIQKESHSSLRQLLITTEKHVRALKKLGQPTDQWSTILVHLMTAKFDNITKRDWERKTSSKEIATYDQFIEFTKSRCVMLETTHLNKPRRDKSSSNIVSKIKTLKRKTITAVSIESKPDICVICKEGDHKIHQCPIFLNSSPQARSKVKRLKIRLNPLHESQAHPRNRIQYLSPTYTPFMP